MSLFSITVIMRNNLIFYGEEPIKGYGLARDIEMKNYE